MFFITSCKRNERKIWRARRRGRKTRAPFVGEKRKFLSKMKTPFSDSWRVNFLSQFFFRPFILSHLCSIVSFPRKLRKWRMKEVSRVLYLRLFSKLDFLFFSVYICGVVQNGFESLFRSFSVVCDFIGREFATVWNCGRCGFFALFRLSRLNF